MKMLKIMIALLMVVVLTLSFAACGSGGNNNDSDGNQTDQSQDIDDDEDESPEAVAERIKAQKEFAEKKEFTMAFGEGNFGLTKEEVEKAVQELKKE